MAINERYDSDDLYDVECGWASRPGSDQVPERELVDGEGGGSREVLHRGHHAGEDQVVAGVCGETFVLGRYWLDL